MVSFPLSSAKYGAGLGLFPVAVGKGAAPQMGAAGEGAAAAWAGRHRGALGAEGSRRWGRAPAQSQAGCSPEGGHR